jgi:hypothetical protein
MASRLASAMRVAGEGEGVEVGGAGGGVGDVELDALGVGATTVTPLERGRWRCRRPGEVGPRRGGARRPEFCAGLDDDDGAVPEFAHARG